MPPATRGSTKALPATSGRDSTQDNIGNGSGLWVTEPTKRIAKKNWAEKGHGTGIAVAVGAVSQAKGRRTALTTSQEMHGAKRPTRVRNPAPLQFVERSTSPETLEIEAVEETEVSSPRKTQGREPQRSAAYRTGEPGGTYYVEEANGARSDAKGRSLWLLFAMLPEKERRLLAGNNPIKSGLWVTGPTK